MCGAKTGVYTAKAIALGRDHVVEPTPLRSVRYYQTPFRYRAFTTAQCPVLAQTRLLCNVHCTALDYAAMKPVQHVWY
eukprot:1349379-Rhodomonas_salina.1